MNISKELEVKISEIVKANGCDLYELAFVKEDGMNILRVMITRVGEGIDLDICALVSESISSILDDYDKDMNEYYLEVCSAGAERELRNNEEIEAAVGSYVYLKLKKAYKKLDEIKGDLLSFENNEVKLAYMDKAVKREALINLDDVSLIRLAVRI